MTNTKRDHTNIIAENYDLESHMVLLNNGVESISLYEF